MFNLGTKLYLKFFNKITCIQHVKHERFFVTDITVFRAIKA
ncbi:hypothetical protein UYSO10_1029 [Kosakonia radicincitans]|nr:hypothetical protein UYSO10_1029 [Kosakonia radicincitans]